MSVYLLWTECYWQEKLHDILTTIKTKSLSLSTVKADKITFYVLLSTLHCCHIIKSKYPI